MIKQIVLILTIVAVSVNSWNFHVTSYDANTIVPERFSCPGSAYNVSFNYGENLSPGFYYSTPPNGTEEVIFVLWDISFPPSFLHWGIVGLPPKPTFVQEGASPYDLPAGSKSMMNPTIGAAAYFGPCPPTGSNNIYVATLFARDVPGTLIKPTDNARDIVNLLMTDGHTIAFVDQSNNFPGVF
eukprot:TRINITY_DN7810_c0_g1_i1.p1 TRINITY_DN7810_c0_g1~~TRINITY_DN7810_c0_g1_i1.p1  ORF type:complete len:184 (+),score=29.96 TRINITY_DN7810_c0_g1_i1:57-608(+)